MPGLDPRRQFLCFFLSVIQKLSKSGGLHIPCLLDKYRLCRGHEDWILSPDKYMHNILHAVSIIVLSGSGRTPRYARSMTYVTFWQRCEWRQDPLNHLHHLVRLKFDGALARDLASPISARLALRDNALSESEEPVR